MSLIEADDGDGAIGVVEGEDGSARARAGILRAMADHLPHDVYAPPRAQPEPSELFGWLFPREPRRLALLFLLVLGLCLAGGGALGLVVHGELYSPEREWISAETYNQVFTAHGALLVFVFMLPAIPAGLGLFAVPRQLGVDRLALPWVGAANFYVFVAAVGLLVLSLFDPIFIGTELPWRMMLGLAGLAMSAALTALVLALTVLRRRRGAGPLPLFCWSVGLGAACTLVTLLLVGLGVAVDRSRPDLVSVVASALPGVVLLPALGVFCEILEVHAHGVSARRLAIAALIVLAVAAVPLWSLDEAGAGVAHGLGRVAVVFLLCAGTVPLLRHARRAVTPLVYALAVVVTLLLAGFVGAVRLALSDAFLDDTYFMVGLVHLRAYVVLLALLGGLHHWWPELTGRRYHETAGRIGAIVVWAGMTLHGVTALVLGHQGMPRRYYTYLPEYTELHRLAGVGAVLITGGLLWVAGTLAWSRRVTGEPGRDGA